MLQERHLVDKISNIETKVGKVLYGLRQDRGLTAIQLAEQSNLSPAMISRIENGNVSPSLGTLQALADALNLPIMSLFSDNDKTSDIHHVRRGQGLPSRRVSPGHAHDYLMLGKHSDTHYGFHSAHIRIERDRAGDLPRYQHEGYVLIYMLGGHANYACGEDIFELNEGDSLSFDAKLRHGFETIHSPHIAFLSVTARSE